MLHFYRASRAAARAGALAVVSTSPPNPTGIGFSEMLQADPETFEVVLSLIEAEDYIKARKVLGLE